MKERSLEIKEALESMKAAERATDFQELAVYLARRRWPELVATERKSDGGEDATSFQRGADGRFCRLACSLTGDLKKVRQDAQRLKDRDVKTDVLVFVTPEPVNNLEVGKWAEAVQKDFGHSLEVLGRAELISQLAQPENDWLCVRYLRMEPFQPDLKQLQNLIPALRPYLQKLAEECQHVTLLGIDPQVGDVTDTRTPELAKVFIHLNTTEKREASGPHQGWTDLTPPLAISLSKKRETDPLPALEAISAKDRSVLLGGPGSGKSTLLRYLSFSLAKHHLGDKRNWLDDLPSERWKSGPPIPVWVELRRVAAACKEQKGLTGESCNIWDYLKARLEKRNLGSAVPAMEAALQAGHALVLLDGLDEVPDAQRGFIRQALESFATGGFRASRMVVTCRVKSYELPELRLCGFGDYRLAELTTEQGWQFVLGWYKECAEKGYQGMTAEEAEKCASSLLLALDNPRLREMAGNPMHLTAMACLHTARAGRPLPEESARLFNLLVDTMLYLWAKAKLKGVASPQDEADELGALLKEGECSEKRLRGCLERMAFQAHQGSQSAEIGGWKPANIMESTLKLELAKLDAKGQRLAWAEKVIDAIRHRAGLLQSEDGHIFQFTYRFQEFLAGCYLADKDAWERDQPKSRDRRRMATFAERAAELYDPAGYWRSVITWAAGVRAHVRDDLGDVRDLIHELCNVPAQPDAFARRKLVLAADLVREVRLRDLLELNWGPETVAALRERLRELVEGTVEMRDFPIREKAEVATQLGWIGDGRKGVSHRTVDGGKTVPDLKWTGVIEPDDFFMGGNDKDCGSRRFTFRLPNPFCIAIYPVTVAQYDLFVRDGGYARQEYWTRAGWEWVKEAQVTSPKDDSNVHQSPNHPCVGITWFEAVAFSNWVNGTFTPVELKLPDKGWKVRLPTEAEWERAARHTDGREFPWNPNTPGGLRDLCNCGETGIGDNTAVGLFPRGKAECDAHDMAGNVWEWCLTKWLDAYHDYERKEDNHPPGDAPRVLRGGSWDCGADFARCAYHVGGNPGSRGRGIGFRLVASPFSPLNSEPSEL